MDRPDYTFVLAPNHRAFRQWCSDNGKHPEDPTVKAITNVDVALRRMSGLKWQEGDRQIELWGRDEFQHGLFAEWIRLLKMMGCPEV